MNKELIKLLCKILYFFLTKIMNKEEKEFKHPSFGMLGFSRINGNSGYLFGTNVQPDNYIEMRLYTGRMKRDDIEDNFYPDNNILTVKMSPVQFSELITSMNYACGVPCTITSFNGKKVEQAKNIENRKTFSARSFNDKMSKFAASINKNMTTAEKLIAKKNLSKKDQEELRMMLYGIQKELTSNIPFFRQMFQEEMDKIVVDAKAEIDAAMQHAVTKAGIKALGLQFNSDNKAIE